MNVYLFVRKEVRDIGFVIVVHEKDFVLLCTRLQNLINILNILYIFSSHDGIIHSIFVFDGTFDSVYDSSKAFIDIFAAGLGLITILESIDLDLLIVCT